jgi:hypothetical protein
MIPHDASLILPIDVFAHVCKYADKNTLLVLRLTCKDIHKHASNDDVWLKHLTYLLSPKSRIFEGRVLETHSPDNTVRHSAKHMRKSYIEQKRLGKFKSRVEMYAHANRVLIPLRFNSWISAFNMNVNAMLKSKRFPYDSNSQYNNEKLQCLGIDVKEHQLVTESFML